MSIKIVKMVFDHYPNGSSKLTVMLALAEWANEDGKSIFPKSQTIADKVRLSKRQAQRVIAKLKKERSIYEDGFTEYGTKRLAIDLDRLRSFPIKYGKQKGKFHEELSKIPDADERNVSVVDDADGEADDTVTVTSVSQEVTPVPSKTVTPSSNPSTPPSPASAVNLDEYRVPDFLADCPSDVIRLLGIAKEEDRKSILDNVEIQVTRGIKGERSEIKDPVGFLASLCKASRNERYRDKQEAVKKPGANQVRLRELRLEYNEKINRLDALNLLLTHDVENPLLLVQAEQAQEDINILLQQIAEHENVMDSI